ncbi:MAG TPA: sialidase family protein [Chryseosolibacter sp.]
MHRTKKTAAALGLTLMAAAFFFSFSLKDEDAGLITVSTFGKQPTLATDQAGNLHVVFGRGNEIFYVRSADGGLTYSAPQKTGEQAKLALGTTRGPQIVSTQDYIVIAAADHSGQIMAYRLKKGEKRWSDPVNILHSDSTAKEGFIAIAAGKGNDVYAAWLDLRIGHHNNIFGAYSHDAGKTWSESSLVYASPDGRVCPCCRPSITADAKGNVYVMFRNDLRGSRDLYLAHSKDGGKSYAPAEKLGEGTWVFDQCPMDGGGISLDPKGRIGTAWRRDKFVYYSEPGKSEVKIAEGRAPSLVRTSRGNYLAWQQGSEIAVLTPGKLAAEAIGTGIYPRLTALADQSVICVWESDGRIVAKKLR